MSKFLIDLLEVRERDFRAFIERLEHVSLHPGIDIRLANEIKHASKRKIAELGGDEADMVKVLHEKLASDDVKLKKKLRLDNSPKPAVVAQHLAITTTKLCETEKALGVTTAGLKRVLTAVPPTKTLKHLGLRSLSSVLKRYDPRALYAAAQIVESKSWNSQVHARMKRAEQRDVDFMPIEAVVLPREWVPKLSDDIAGRGYYLSIREVAAIVIIPVVQLRRAGMCTLALGLLLQAGLKLAMESLPYKRRGLLKGNQTVLPELAHGLQPQLQAIHGLLPTWAVIYRIAGGAEANLLTGETNFLTADLEWQSVEVKLAKLVPEMAYWIDSHYLALQHSNGQTQSLHVIDIATDLALDKNGSRAHFEASLWNELQLRYLREDVFNNALSKQLISNKELMLY